MAINNKEINYSANSISWRLHYIIPSYTNIIPSINNKGTPNISKFSINNNNK